MKAFGLLGRFRSINTLVLSVVIATVVVPAVAQTLSSNQPQKPPSRWSSGRQFKGLPTSTIERKPQPNVGSLPKRIAPPPMKAAAEAKRTDSKSPMQWWGNRVSQQVLERPRWVAFDLETILVDTLRHSPRIKSVSYRTSTAIERIVQQDAAFDPTVLLSGTGGRTNDPVGSVLTTGGANRLQEESVTLEGGFRRTSRTGTEYELSQQVEWKDSNSTFFDPREQGTSRLSLSLTKPLLDRGGVVYNERLLTQARIESRVAWQEMRGEVEQRIAEVITAYWQLYQLRCELTQQRELLVRGQEIQRLLQSRRNFDAGRIELIKAKQRIARRSDQVLAIEAELKKQQAKLASFVGTDTLRGADLDLELIPVQPADFPTMDWDLRDAVARAMHNRPEIRAATNDVEASTLELNVSRTELLPQLNAVFNGYLSALNGNHKVGKSLGDQFENGPGFSAGLEYELPYQRRAARGRLRESQQRYLQRSADLKETIQQTAFEVESALIDVRRYAKQQQSKLGVLATAIDEENILTVRWRMIGGDGSRVGIVLENLLDAQQRRTDAERDLVAAQAAYLNSLVQLQRAMGTLLINEGITPSRHAGTSTIQFQRDSHSIGSESPSESIPVPYQSDLMPQLLEPQPNHSEPSEEVTPPLETPQIEELPAPVPVKDPIDSVQRSRSPIHAIPVSHPLMGIAPKRSN